MPRIILTSEGAAKNQIRRILRLKKDGYSIEEISTTVKRNVPHIKMVLEKYSNCDGEEIFSYEKDGYPYSQR